jgi:pimeloyl-ACP methyl ester carboxylesterase
LAGQLSRHTTLGVRLSRQPLPARGSFGGQRSSEGHYVLTDTDLSSIGRPVLFIWGAGDNRYQPIEEARRKAQLIPHGEFQVVDGGHEPCSKIRQRCIHLVDQFLSVCAGRLGSRDATLL